MGKWLAGLRYHPLRTAVALLFVLPLIWVATFSLRKPGLPPPRSIEWIPDPVAWGNYARIFDIIPLATSGNSLLVAAIAVTLFVIQKVMRKWLHEDHV